jgi:hypothetical protein
MLNATAAVLAVRVRRRSSFFTNIPGNKHIQVIIPE